VAVEPAFTEVCVDTYEPNRAMHGRFPVIALQRAAMPPAVNYARRTAQRLGHLSISPAKPIQPHHLLIPIGLAQRSGGVRLIFARKVMRAAPLDNRRARSVQAAGHISIVQAGSVQAQALSVRHQFDPPSIDRRRYVIDGQLEPTPPRPDTVDCYPLGHSHLRVALPGLISLHPVGKLSHVLA
jgi:hypothetical protein